MRRPTGEATGEDGSAIVEFLWLGILLLVPLTYLMVTVFAVQRASFGVSAAAESAARAYSLAPTESAGPARARAAAATAMADQGLDVGRAVVSIRCTPTPGNCLAPGGLIEVSITEQVRLPLVPDALGGGSPSIRVEARHVVAYGTHREDR